MACSHKKTTILCEGKWKGKKPGVSVHYSRILQCDSCYALRIDKFNESVFKKGVWSSPVGNGWRRKV